jgi:hypothetical protein
MRLIIGLLLVLYVHTGCAQRILVVDEAKIRQKLELAGHSIENIDTLIAAIGADHISIPTTKAVVDYVADLGGLDTAYVAGDSLFLVQGVDTLLLILPDIHIGKNDLTLTENRTLNANSRRFSLANPYFTPSPATGSGFTEYLDVFNVPPGKTVFVPVANSANTWFRNINSYNDTTSAFLGWTYNITDPIGVIGWDSYQGMMLDTVGMGLGEEIQIPVMGISTWFGGAARLDLGETYFTNPTGRYAWNKWTDAIRHSRSVGGFNEILHETQYAGLTGPKDTLGLRLYQSADSLGISMAQDGDGAGGFDFQTVFAISPEKVVRMPQYGTGSTISGSAVNIAAWDTDGNMVPVHPDSLGGGGGGITLDTVLLQSDTLIDWNSKNFKVIQLDMTSVTSITLEFANPTDPLFGTLHFRNVAGTDSVTFPGNVYWMDETAVGTLNITQSGKYSLYYDGSDYYME